MALGFLGGVGCEDVAVDVRDARIDRSDAGEPDVGEARTATITVAWTTVDVFDGDPLEDVRICVFERPEVPCARSGADGSFELHDVPSNQRLMFSFERHDLFPVLRAYRTTEVDERNESFALPPRETIELAGLLNDVELDPAKAIVSFGVVTRLDPSTGDYDRPAGVQAELIPASGVPYYVNDARLPDITRAGTSSVGLGGFFAVDPGEYEIVFRASARECRRSTYGRAWPASREDAIGARAVAGWLTGAEWIACD